MKKKKKKNFQIFFSLAHSMGLFAPMTVLHSKVVLLPKKQPPTIVPHTVGGGTLPFLGVYAALPRLRVVWKKNAFQFMRKLE
jgi:hypothetical protein